MYKRNVLRFIHGNKCIVCYGKLNTQGITRKCYLREKMCLTLLTFSMIKINLFYDHALLQACHREGICFVKVKYITLHECNILLNMNESVHSGFGLQSIYKSHYFQ